MEYLDKLEISQRVLAAEQKRRKPNSIEYRRQKLASNIEEQLELAKKAINGDPLELPRKRGHTVSIVRPRIWWRTNADGHTATEVYYDRVALNIGGRGRTVEVGKLRKLPSTYRILIRAVLAGELDSSIKTARLPRS